MGLLETCPPGAWSLCGPGLVMGQEQCHGTSEWPGPVDGQAGELGASGPRRRYSLPRLRHVVSGLCPGAELSRVVS